MNTSRSNWLLEFEVMYELKYEFLQEFVKIKSKYVNIQMMYIVIIKRIYTFN